MRKRDDAIRYRAFERNLPKRQEMAQGRTAGGNDISKQLRQNNRIQPGNEMKRAIRPYHYDPRRDLAYNTVGFVWDGENNHDEVTYYRTPQHLAENPMRPDGRGLYNASQPAWSTVKETAEANVVTPLNMPEVGTIIPEFTFDHTITGDIVMKIKIELLDRGDKTIREYVYQAQVHGSDDLTVSYIDNRDPAGIPPDFGTDTHITEFWGIRVTWDALLVNLSAPFGGGDLDGPFANICFCSLTWFMPTLLPDGLSSFGAYRHWYPYDYVKVKGLTDNVITCGNVDFRSEIIWANEDDHHAKLPWHNVTPQRLMASPVFFFNKDYQYQSSSVGAFLSSRIQIFTVDFDGNDLEEILLTDLQAHLGPTSGFRGLQGTTGQTLEANGFYFKISRQWSDSGHTVSPIEINILNLLQPLRIWWSCLDTPETPP